MNAREGNKKPYLLYPLLQQQQLFSILFIVVCRICIQVTWTAYAKHAGTWHLLDTPPNRNQGMSVNVYAMSCPLMWHDKILKKWRVQVTLSGACLSLQVTWCGQPSQWGWERPIRGSVGNSHSEGEKDQEGEACRKRWSWRKPLCSSRKGPTMNYRNDNQRTHNGNLRYKRQGVVELISCLMET